MILEMIFYSALAQAADPSLQPYLERRRLILMELQEAANYAEIELPPCEGLDYLSNAALRYVPPKTCVRARKFFDYIEKFDSNLRTNCREMSRWLEGELRGPSLCADKSKYESGLRQLKSYRVAAYKAIDEVADDPLMDFTPDNFEDPEKAKGEMANTDCALPITIGMQVRRRQLSLANKHYGVASQEMDELCSGTVRAESRYLIFLRSGEKALSVTP